MYYNNGLKSWPGKNYIKEDLHDQNNKGKLFQEFIERNLHLNILNTSEKCTGKVTRSRYVKNRKEESIIDFVIVCDKVLPHFEHMIIDEEKEDALVNFNSKKPGEITKTSDHNSIFVDFHFKMKPEKVETKIFIL